MYAKMPRTIALLPTLRKGLVGNGPSKSGLSHKVCMERDGTNSNWACCLQQCLPLTRDKLFLVLDGGSVKYKKTLTLRDWGTIKGKRQPYKP